MDYRTLTDFQVEEFAGTAEDVCGRQYEKTQMLINLFDDGFGEMLYLSTYAMYLLTGPVGYGKSYLATCCAQSLKDSAEYDMYHIDFADFIDEEEPEKVWKSLGEEIVENSAPEEMRQEKICLYLENLGLVGENRKLTRMIEATLKKIEDKQCVCVVYATAIDAAEIPVAILRHFSILELGLPSEADRVELFTKFLAFEVSDDSDGDFRLDSEEEKTLAFYPLDVKNVMDEELGEDADELDKIALYCARKTEGFSYRQLMAIVENLSKALKMRLIAITDRDIKSVAAHIKHGQSGNEKTYVIKEEDFLEIIANVKKAEAILMRAQAGRQTEASGNMAVVSQPQIIYAMPTPEMIQQGMGQQGMMQQGIQGQSYNNHAQRGGMNQEQAKLENETISKIIASKDPSVGDLVKVFQSLPDADNVEHYINSES